MHVPRNKFVVPSRTEIMYLRAKKQKHDAFKVLVNGRNLAPVGNYW